MAAIKPLYESWRAARDKYRTSAGGALQTFTERLIRRLTIETGILERLYELDRGTTEALIQHGFAEDLVARSSTDIEPSRLIDILRDQEDAAKLVMDCVAGSLPVTKGFLHQLHTMLTRHQDTTNAVDQFGTRVEIPLLRGEFKKQPNNPRRPDGSIHEYCPPVHVDAEIERLLTLFSSYSNEDPVIVSAWLHHRFAQIHPYQDGNGRVARALITLVLLRADLLPMVIERDLKAEYLDALETADRGDLERLAHIFARLERQAILQALSIDVDRELHHEKTLASAVIESLAAKFAKRRLARDEELRAVNKLTLHLRARTREIVNRLFSELSETVESIGDPDVHVTDGGPDRQNAHYYKYDVIRSSESSGKFVNFSEDHYFIKATIRAGTERLVFVVSFHHVGRELTGIVEVTAFTWLESYLDPKDREEASAEYFPCSLEPFVITWKTKEQEIANAYEQWLDAAMAIAIKEYGDRL